MIHQPKLSARKEQPYVGIPIEVTLREWGRANALFDELFSWLDRNRIQMDGPPFFRYWLMGSMDVKFAIEAGVPVPDPVKATGRICTDVIEGGGYVSLIHEGHPDRLAESHQLVHTWAEREGIVLERELEEDREVWGGLYEFYLTDPAVEADPNRWVTEIAYRVREDAPPRGVLTPTAQAGG